MMSQLQQELEEKEEALASLQTTVEEHREAEPLPISIVEANIMTESPLVSSLSIGNSQEKLGEF
jgi:hypothetical protein